MRIHRIDVDRLRRGQLISVEHIRNISAQDLAFGIGEIYLAGFGILQCGNGDRFGRTAGHIQRDLCFTLLISVEIKHLLCALSA